MSVKGLLLKAAKNMEGNLPFILAGAALAGLGISIYEMHKATPKIDKIIDEAQEDIESASHEEAKSEIKKEAAKDLVKAAAPVAAAVIFTSGCIISSAMTGKKQQVQLLGSYILLEQTFKQYRQKAIDLFGYDADKDIRHEMAREEAQKDLHPLSGEEEVIFYDELSKRYFSDTIENVRRAEMDLNHQLSLYSYVDLNKFYELLDNEEMPPTEDGALRGWSIYQGNTNYGYTWIDFVHEKVTLDDGMECIYIHTPIDPHIDYLWV